LGFRTHWPLQRVGVAASVPAAQTARSVCLAATAQKAQAKHGQLGVGVLVLQVVAAEALRVAEETVSAAAAAAAAAAADAVAGEAAVVAVVAVAACAEGVACSTTATSLPAA